MGGRRGVWEERREGGKGTGRDEVLTGGMYMRLASPHTWPTAALSLPRPLCLHSTTQQPTHRALETLVTEVARVRLYGFSEREFNNAVKNMQVCASRFFKDSGGGGLLVCLGVCLWNVLSRLTSLCVCLHKLFVTLHSPPPAPHTPTTLAPTKPTPAVRHRVHLP